MKVSVVVSAFNEEQKLAECLESVKKIADEIIVINNSSTDLTEKIAKKYTDKVYTRENLAMLNTNKNFGFLKASGQWILNLDADERITKELEEEISKIEDSTPENGFLIPRKNILFGKWIKHSIWWPDYQLRLFRRNKGKFAEKHVHEYIEVDGEVGKLQSPIKHLNYESISQYIYKLEKIYTVNEVDNIIQSGKKLYWYDALRMPVSDFLKTFFMQKGYKDGLHGLILSLLQSFYMVIVFAKVWEKQGFEEENITLSEVSSEMSKLGKEIKYWILTSSLDESSSRVKLITTRIKRKLLKKTS